VKKKTSEPLPDSPEIILEYPEGKTKDINSEREESPRKEEKRIEFGVSITTN